MVIERTAEDFPDPQQIGIYRRMGPVEKLETFNRLYWQAWEVKRAGVRMRHPDWDDETVENEVGKIFIRTVT